MHERLHECRFWCTTLPWRWTASTASAFVCRNLFCLVTTSWVSAGVGETRNQKWILGRPGTLVKTDPIASINILECVIVKLRMVRRMKKGSKKTVLHPSLCFDSISQRLTPQAEDSHRSVSFYSPFCLLASASKSFLIDVNINRLIASFYPHALSWSLADDFVPTVITFHTLPFELLRWYRRESIPCLAPFSTHCWWR